MPSLHGYELCADMKPLVFPLEKEFLNWEKFQS